MMNIPLAEMLDAFSPEARTRIDQHAAQIVAQNRSLSDVRKALKLTQDDVAKILKTSQSNVAQIERSDDVMISTLKNVVEALGGKLELSVSIPGHPRIGLTLGRNDGNAVLRHPKKPLNSARPKTASVVRPARARA